MSYESIANDWVDKITEAEIDAGANPLAQWFAKRDKIIDLLKELEKPAPPEEEWPTLSK